MKVYGVTGTNGKTTTSVLLGSVLREVYGKDKVGLITTIVFWLGEEEKVNETKMTTMNSRAVYKLLREMRRRGIEQVVIEITSHALDQHRLAGIALDGAIILNVAREHLDYHGTMQEYAQAKSRIVSYVKKKGALVYKVDDKWIQRAIVNNLQVKSLISKAKISAIQFTKIEAAKVATVLEGGWNRENVLAVSLLAKAIGLEGQKVQEGIRRIKQVPGRMEWIEPILATANLQLANNKLPRVLIDYAVTPDSLDQLYKEVSRGTSGKIFAVLGACGRRDRGKRPKMARTVAQYADELVLTREDPWTEEEEQIFNDLEKGLNFSKTRKADKAAISPGLLNYQAKGTKQSVWQRIVDRREAIKYCIDRAGADDVVVVTGKGAETGMAIGEKILPWSDKQVIQELLQEKQGGMVR